MQFSALCALSILVAACCATPSPSDVKTTVPFSPGSPGSKLLDKRQSCDPGFGVCSGDFCCSLNDSCCPDSCCPYVSGSGADCCSDGGCCQPGTRCIGNGECAFI